MSADGVELPIFELPLVLLPGELLPLHIFEERYKRMIDHCVDDSEPFGVVFRDEEGGARRVGCEARVTEVTERFEDGRLNIIVTGERPFSVLDRYDASGYPAGEVEPVEPAAIEPADVERDDAGNAEAARAAFAELVRRVGADGPEPRRARGARRLRARRARRAAARDQAAAAGAALRARAHARARHRARHPGRHRRALARHRRPGADERQADHRRRLEPRRLGRTLSATPLRPRRRAVGRRRRGTRPSQGRGRRRARRRRRRCGPASGRPRSRAAGAW